MTVPLALLSQLAQAVTLSNRPADNAEALSALLGASDWVQRQANRRFDTRIETRYYTACSLAYGGAVDGYDLLLDDDLRSITTLTNGDGTSISTGYTLQPRSPDKQGVTAYRRIRLNPYGSVTWGTAGMADPEGAIQVSGLWGYGGRWVSAGVTVSATTSQSDSATSLAISSGLIETGSLLKIDSEYQYVQSGGTSTTLTVERAVNGSTAAAHSTSTAIYRWQPMDIVTRLVVRLTAWDLAINKSPLFAQLTVGDVTYPTVTDGLPKDLLHAVTQLGLRVPVMPSAV